MLQSRLAAANPLRVVLVGAGKFGAMYLAQARVTPGVHVAAVCDLRPERARTALARTGWPEAQYRARSLQIAYAEGTTLISDDVEAIIASDGLDVVVEATGDPVAGIRHALAAIGHGKSIIMANVEADALAGPLIARRAADAGVVYSLAYGDQPALICEMVDWARASGFEVVAAGKGTKYLPAYHASTPDTVWRHYGLAPEQTAGEDFNAQMFNSFIDGTKSAIEMAAVANATALVPPAAGLSFPPCGANELAQCLKPRADGGQLERRGQVEVVSSLHRDGRSVERDLRWGVFVVFAAGSRYVESCFRQYGLSTDDTGRYAAMFKPYHLIGLELGVSVASVALRREATGSPVTWSADVVATAKRDLRIGELLDGEGGYTVYGRLLPAAESLRFGGLPIGLARDVRLRNNVPEGKLLRWEDVEFDPGAEVVRIRRELEAMHGDGR